MAAGEGERGGQRDGGGGREGDVGRRYGELGGGEEQRAAHRLKRGAARGMAAGAAASAAGTAAGAYERQMQPAADVPPLFLAHTRLSWWPAVAARRSAPQRGRRLGCRRGDWRALGERGVEEVGECSEREEVGVAPLLYPIAAPHATAPLSCPTRPRSYMESQCLL
uniref:Uncharacterized protein n=1 Tax=Oryza barthii TaxID=65489 RepID=A0A0D3GG82_9ORYZ